MVILRGCLFNYYMAVAMSDLNMEILQFDWFISGQIFPILPAWGKAFKKHLLMSNKDKMKCYEVFG